MSMGPATFAIAWDTRFNKYRSRHGRCQRRILGSGERSCGDSALHFALRRSIPGILREDVNEGGGYQHSGFDLFFTSGLTNNLPAMIPVTMLYGTPDDAAAQIAYIEKRGYPIGYIEMGEEPDGKHAMPEDYAALYLQWATAIHKVDPKLKLGGPIFEGVNEDIRVWPDAQGRTSWMGRFVDYLKSHGRLVGPFLCLFRALSI